MFVALWIYFIVIMITRHDALNTRLAWFHVSLYTCDFLLALIVYHSLT